MAALRKELNQKNPYDESAYVCPERDAGSLVGFSN